MSLPYSFRVRSVPCARSWLFRQRRGFVSRGLGCLAIVGALSARVVFAQGCIPAHYVSLSLGAQGISYLQPGQFEGDLFYRYLYSDVVFIGTQEQSQLYEQGARHAINSFDLNV